MSVAVIKTGGKQYLVEAGSIITIEKLAGDFKKGDTVTFNDVLLKDSEVGAPTVSGATVTGEVVSVGRNPKVEILRYKAKSRYMKRSGHRQPHLKVQITKI